MSKSMKEANFFCKRSQVYLKGSEVQGLGLVKVNKRKATLNLEPLNIEPLNPEPRTRERLPFFGKVQLL